MRDRRRSCRSPLVVVAVASVLASLGACSEAPDGSPARPTTAPPAAPRPAERPQEAMAGAPPPALVGAEDPAVASAPAPAPETARLPEPSEEARARAARTLREAPLDVMDGLAVARRLASYGELARLGLPVVVRFPLVQASLGWGCACPGMYVGADPNGHPGGETWLDVRTAPGVSLPTSGRLGRVSWVEGVFTGERTELDLRGDQGPSEWLYHLRVVHVVRVVSASAPHGDDSLVIRAVRLAEPSPRFVCRTRTDDPDPPTRVRAAASNRAPIVGELASGTELELVAFERGWLHIRAPLEGYVFGRVTSLRCEGDPP